MKRRIWVFGGSAFPGSAIVQALAATAWAEPIAADASLLADSAALSVALAPDAGIVNCLSGNARLVRESARALFAAAAKMPAARIIHLSSMTVYGSATGIVDEAAELRGDLGPYSAARVESDRLAAAHPGTVVFRLGCEFGPGSEYWAAALARCLLQRRLGDLGAAGDGYANIIDADDIANAVVCALSSPEAGARVFNLCNSEVLRWNDFLTRYAIALGAVPVHRIPDRRLRLESRLMAAPRKAAALLAGRLGIDCRRRPAPITASLLNVLGQELRLDVRRVESVYPVRWTSLEESLRKAARWVLQAARSVQ